MNKPQIVANTFFAILCAAFISTKSFAEPLNLSHFKSELRAYHDSGAYEKEFNQVVTNARRYINQRVEANSHKANPQKLAIVLDIDETCISDYDRMSTRDFASDLEKITQGYNEATSPAIQSMLALYHDALKHHVAVFFVTGRNEMLREPTEKNLKNAGYEQWTGLYFKPLADQLTQTYKTQTRNEITKQGYHIIASLGDQTSDLKGGFADKTFKLPNPYYEVL